jgi:hypothetical protein
MPLKISPPEVSGSEEVVKSVCAFPLLAVNTITMKRNNLK